MDRKTLAVVSVLGRDQKGVVARFATYMAERGINLEDLEQRVVRGLFVMDVLVDLADMTCDLSDLVPGLIDLGKQMGMEVRVHLHAAREPKRVAVLVSREPHCLERLIADASAGKMHGKIDGVLSNHPDLRPTAEAAGLEFESRSSDDPEAHFEWLLSELRQRKPDLVVLARYMRILPGRIVDAFPSRIVNIHPSLLPFFPGAAPYRQAFDSGVRVSGCTAHFVTEELDQGPIILQDVFHIDVGTDALDDVKAKGLALEAATLAEAVRLALDEEVVVVDGKVVFKPGLSRFLKAAGA